MITIVDVHEIRVFEYDTQNFVLTISLNIEVYEFGMNFDADLGKAPPVNTYR